MRISQIFKASIVLGFLLIGAAPALLALAAPSAATPEITSLSRTFGERGAQLVIAGSGFRAGKQGLAPSQVRFSGVLLPTTFVSDHELKFMVPTDAACGEHPVQVVNSSGSPGEPSIGSNILTFIVIVPFICDGSAGNLPPVAGFRIALAAVFSGQPVQFTDQSSDPDGFDDIRSWSWNFGDGTGSTERDPVHIFRAAGTYHVRMVVKDSAGQKGSSFLSIKVAASLSSSEGGDALLRYDTNNNLRLDDLEFFLIVDGWLAGDLDQSLLFKAVDLWVVQAPLLAASWQNSSRPFDAKLRARWLRSGQFLEIGRLDAASLTLEVFSITGALIDSSKSPGRRLDLSSAKSIHKPIANGVYLVRIRAFDASGAMIEQRVERLILLR